MAEGDRGGGWVPPNGDDDDRDRTGPAQTGSGGLSSGDPLGGGLSSGDPLGGGGPQAGWEPPGSAGGAGGAGGQQGGWAPPGQGTGVEPGSWQSPPAPQQGGQWGPPAGAGQWGGQPGGFGAPQQGSSNGKATASLICGIVGLIFCPIIFSIAAIVLGYRSRKEIDASQGRQTNRGLATAGIITGWIGLVLGILLIALVAAGVIAGLNGAEDGTFEFSEPAFALLSSLPL